MKFLRKIIFVTVFLFAIATFGIFAYILKNNQDPEVYLKSLLLNQDNTIIKAFFSPDDDLKEILLNLISYEKKSIKLTIYTLTQKDIAKAIIDAHERGVVIKCVVDRSYGYDRFSKISNLANNNIPIWVYQTDNKNSSLMHNKFIIFKENIMEKSIVWTGSYNLTNRASNANQENIIILDNKDIIDRYKEQFKILKTRSLLISGNIKKNRTYSNKKNIKIQKFDLDYLFKYLFKLVKKLKL